MGFFKASIQGGIIIYKRFFQLITFIVLPLLILLTIPAISSAASSIRFVVKTNDGVLVDKQSFLADKNFTVPDGCDVQTNAGSVGKEGANVACSVVASGFSYSFRNYLPDLFLTSLNGKSGNWQYYVNGTYATVSMDKYILGSGDVVVLTLDGASSSLPTPPVSPSQAAPAAQEPVPSNPAPVAPVNNQPAANPPAAANSGGTVTNNQITIVREELVTTDEVVRVEEPKEKVVKKENVKPKQLPKTGPEDFGYLFIVVLISSGVVLHKYSKVIFLSIKIKRK